MKTNFRILAGIIIGLLSIIIGPVGDRKAFAADKIPPGPDRFALITQDYTAYHWWLTGYVDNQVICSIVMDHDNLPDGGDIFSACGKTVFEKWAATDNCLSDAICEGYYLQLISTEPAQRELGVKLPPAVIWVSLNGCTPINSTFLCNKLPTLLLTGEEPLEGETVIGIEGIINGTPFSCDSVCPVELSPTGSEGQNLEFWAYSSYGDSSELFTARVRVIAVDDSAQNQRYVDVLSSQWSGPALAACSEAWDTFPPVGGVPDWLSTPQKASQLASNISYEYLAGKLIQQGLVDISTCDEGGMETNGQPSACGLEVSRAAVIVWQNRFDDQILTAAQESGIPARLLKKVFARESQFWPGISTAHPEVGLGQMTEGGADTTLLWNRPFFEQFCPAVLDESECLQGYPHINSIQQDILRQALVNSVDASCPDCSLGVDIPRVEKSVPIFADTILANCNQTAMIVQNTFGGAAGQWVGFEDLWRFTLVNYNAGPGCLTLAIWETKRFGEALDWRNLSRHLTPACRGALEYVSDISGTRP
jgi:hypothetical protein